MGPGGNIVAARGQPQTEEECRQTASPQSGGQQVKQVTAGGQPDRLGGRAVPSQHSRRRMRHRHQ